MTADEIKQRVPITRLVEHYGGTLNAKGEGRCLCAVYHHNGDADPSMTVKDDRVMCWSQKCFGEHGADVFDVVGVMEHLVSFADKKRRVLEIGGFNGHAEHTTKKQIAVYDYMDESGALLFQTVRYTPKDFRQRRPDGSSCSICRA